MALIFFVLVAFAGFTSAISLLEVVVSYAEETHDMDRTRVAWMSGALIFALGVLCALSFNALSDFKIWHYNFFDLFGIVFFYEV